MRKVIASINMTLDGYCDHTDMIATDELHEHFSAQIRNNGPLLMGRITYQLMESAWPPMVSHPTGNKADDEFAVLMDDAEKIVFSKTLKDVAWKNTRLAVGELTKEVIQLKAQPGKDIAVGSPSLVAQLTQAGLIDEFRLCIHPVVAGSGLVLFKDITETINLRLLETTRFESGVVVVYYERE